MPWQLINRCLDVLFCCIWRVLSSKVDKKISYIHYLTLWFILTSYLMNRLIYIFLDLWFYWEYGNSWRKVILFIHKIFSSLVGLSYRYQFLKEVGCLIECIYVHKNLATCRTELLLKSEAFYWHKKDFIFLYGEYQNLTMRNIPWNKIWKDQENRLKPPQDICKYFLKSTTRLDIFSFRQKKTLLFYIIGLM